MPFRDVAGLVLALGTLPASAAAAQEPASDKAAALFAYDASAALDLQTHGREDGGAFDRLDVSFRSPKGGRVPAYLFVPHAPGPHAGVLLMHGMPGSRDNTLRLGARYAEEGAVAVAISAPFARGDERYPTPVTFTDADRDQQIHLIIDLRRAIDLLLQREDVDPARLAYVGGSYGGAMGGLLAGVEHRLKAYVLMIGDGGLVTHFTGPEDANGPLAGLRPPAREAWLAAMDPIEPIHFVGQASPAALLFQQGRGDRLVPESDGVRYSEAGSEPKVVRWYPDGHRVSAAMIEDQVAWLVEWIGRAGGPTRF